jgi:alpha-L-fucosidase
MGKSAAAANVFQKDVAGYGPDKAFDGNPETRWATDGGTHAAWLEVDLGAPVTVNRAMIREAFAGRAKEFELQAKRDGQWQTFARGTEIGEDRLLTFGPITAQVIRLNILSATEGPTISEFQLFAAKK